MGSILLGLAGPTKRDIYKYAPRAEKDQEGRPPHPTGEVQSENEEDEDPEDIWPPATCPPTLRTVLMANMKDMHNRVHMEIDILACYLNVHHPLLLILEHNNITRHNQQRYAPTGDTGVVVLYHSDTRHKAYWEEMGPIYLEQGSASSLFLGPPLQNTPNTMQLYPPQGGTITDKGPHSHSILRGIHSQITEGNYPGRQIKKAAEQLHIDYATEVMDLGHRNTLHIREMYDLTEEQACAVIRIPCPQLQDHSLPLGYPLAVRMITSSRYYLLDFTIKTHCMILMAHLGTGWNKKHTYPMSIWYPEDKKINGDLSTTTSIGQDRTENPKAPGTVQQESLVATAEALLLPPDTTAQETHTHNESEIQNLLKTSTFKYHKKTRDSYIQGKIFSIITSALKRQELPNNQPEEEEEEVDLDPDAFDMLEAQNLVAPPPLPTSTNPPVPKPTASGSRANSHNSAAVGPQVNTTHPTHTTT
ncbi:MAG: hypothetical protein ACK5PF_02555, partial [bacterium]